jgi:hypothetical protein
MKKPLKYLLAAVVALIVGGAIGYFSPLRLPELIARSASVKNGPWFTNLTTGSTEANIYTRAWIAKHALLALTKSETLYYRAYSDDEGEPLIGTCDYRIEGKALDTRWWSITAYGADDFLILNEENRYSYSGSEVAHDADGRYRIYLSRTSKEGNWLPTGNEERFSLTLRLYNPGQTFYQNPATVELPHIIKEGCK